MSSLQPVLLDGPTLDLHTLASTREIERRALAETAHGELMARAGASLARLVRATYPNARCVQVLAGGGNNGGDGLIAATILHRHGTRVVVTLAIEPERLAGDARWALEQAQLAGVQLQAADPAVNPDDVFVDALLGIGALGAPRGRIAELIGLANASGNPVIAADVPSGLNVDTGQAPGGLGMRANHTLSLLTLKPGLFTAAGRDHCGQVWLDDLGVRTAGPAPLTLPGLDEVRLAVGRRRHSDHKGSFGDVLVVEGDARMAGASRLAARAALAIGAGRVYLGASGHAGSPAPDTTRPELMRADLEGAGWQPPPPKTVVVAGCGGGDAAADRLPWLLGLETRLVLDADALNALSLDDTSKAALRQRQAQGRATVITPHPLEAARLLGIDTAAVQADRLTAAQRLADDLRCVVVLKGSGSIIAAPGRPAAVIRTGNARLSSPGTGDVLAGTIAGLLAMRQPAPPDVQGVATTAAWLHGRTADVIDPTDRLPVSLHASEVVERLRLLLPGL